MASINLKTKPDITKTNPSLLETYTVKFLGDLEQYKGSVTVKFRHVTAQALAKCQVSDDDGEINTQATFFNIFAKCVKEVHGIKHEIINDEGNVESVEMTVQDIVNFSQFDAKSDEGNSALQIIYNIVYDTAMTIMSKSTLTDVEEKN